MLQLIASSTNSRQILALRRIDQRLTGRIDVSVDWHIGVIEPERDQISAHDPVDDCARLHQFNELRPDISLKLFMGKGSAPPREFFGVGRQLPVRLARLSVVMLIADRFLQPFHQCHLSGS